MLPAKILVEFILKFNEAVITGLQERTQLWSAPSSSTGTRCAYLSELNIPQHSGQSDWSHRGCLLTQLVAQ